MGLFSSKIVVHRSSSVWNLGGDLGKRPNFLKAAIFRHIVTGGPKASSMSSNILGSLKNGTVLGDRRLYRYNFTDYPYRIAHGELRSSLAIEPKALYDYLRQHLELAETQKLRVFVAEIDHVDVRYFAEAWLYQNQPQTLGELWEGEFDKVASKVVVNVNDVEVARFDPLPDLLWVQASDDRRLLYASYQVSTLNAVTGLYEDGLPTLFTYRMGSGVTALDAMASDAIPMSDFFPVIPLRMEKKYISDPVHSDLYPELKKAFRSLTGGSVNKLIDQISENDEVNANVDSIYLVKGVNVYTEDKIAREYVFRFFEWLAGVSQSAPDAMREYLAAEGKDIYANWRDESTLTGSTQSPFFGKIVPDVQTVSTEQPRRTELTVRSVTAERFQYKIAWSEIHKENFTGNFKRQINPEAETFAKVGDIEIVLLQPESWPFQHLENVFSRVFADRAPHHFAIYKQTGRYKYTRILVKAPRHENYVYQHYPVTTLAQDALDPNSDPDSTGFILPLHYPTWQSFGLAQRNQLSFASSYLVFNVYTKQKVRWYQRGIFKLVLGIVMVAVAFLTGGAGFLGFGSGGMLGSNIAVGIAAGASGASAVVVGAIANYLAAIVVSQLVSLGATKIFGEKLGAILGTILTFVAMTYAGQYAQFGNFDVNWTSILDVRNIMQLTNSVTSGYSQWLNADTASIYEDMENLSEEQKKRLEEINERSREILGETSGEIDPMLLTDATEYFEETPESFLGRTLLTGSEIAALSHAMISEFSSVSLELPGLA